MLFLRTDANTQIGTGHLMRCLALAQAWQKEEDRPVFLTCCESKSLYEPIRKAGMTLTPLEHTHPDPLDVQATLCSLEDFRKQYGASRRTVWVVLDGYHFDPGYQQSLREGGYPLVVIDDTAHWPRYYADLVLNQNINAEKLDYDCLPNTSMLLGPRYVQLREEFLSWRGWKRHIPQKARRLLVTMGGSDPNNATLQVMRAIEKLNVRELETILVVGASNPHFHKLLEAVSHSKSKIRLEYNCPEMSKLMSWADFAISAAGITCWELAFMGVPSAVLALAENQRAVAQALHEAGVATNLGWYEQIDPETIAQVLNKLRLSGQKRETMSALGRTLVDGFGPDRVLAHLRGHPIRLRRVVEQDAAMLFKWANDIHVRAVSFSSEPISWQEHLNWLASKVSDPLCFFFVAVNKEERLIGQARFDLKGEEADISVSLDPHFRGMGNGRALIRLACQKVRRLSGANVIHAYVKKDNDRSIKAFLGSGFERVGETTIHGKQSVHLVSKNGDKDELH